MRLLGYAHRKAEEIMPCDYSKYPANWKTEIRPAILERAEHCCEFCGVPNCAIIQRSRGNNAHYRKLASSDTANGLKARQASIGHDPKWQKPIRVVLTIAHLDHDTTNNDHDNLAALCQRCHLRYDAELHAETRRKNKK
jgi:5-methylcytosine-specific restriction endonuclease McrA